MYLLTGLEEILHDIEEYEVHIVDSDEVDPN